MRLWTFRIVCETANAQCLVWLCREEDAAERSSRLAQQRVEALKRADARAAEEVLRARDFERQQLAAQRCAPYCLFQQCGTLGALQTFPQEAAACACIICAVHIREGSHLGLWVQG